MNSQELALHLMSLPPGEQARQKQSILTEEIYGKPPQEEPALLKPHTKWGDYKMDTEIAQAGWKSKTLYYRDSKLLSLKQKQEMFKLDDPVLEVRSLQKGGPVLHAAPYDFVTQIDPSNPTVDSVYTAKYHNWPERLRADLKQAAKSIPHEPVGPAIGALNSVLAHLLEAWITNCKLRIQIQQELLGANVPTNILHQITQNFNKQIKNDSYFINNFCDGTLILQKENLNFQESWNMLTERQEFEQQYCRKDNPDEKKNAGYKKRMRKTVSLPVFDDTDKEKLKTKISDNIFKNSNPDVNQGKFSMKKSFFAPKRN